MLIVVLTTVRVIAISVSREAVALTGSIYSCELRRCGNHLLEKIESEVKISVRDERVHAINTVGDGKRRKGMA